jgi:hypothetical protein
MGDMQIEELRGPFDTIIRRCRQVAQDLESQGKDTEAEAYYMHANKVKEVKESMLGN